MTARPVASTPVMTRRIAFNVSLSFAAVAVPNADMTMFSLVAGSL
jgi:hypothetical protein